MALSMPPLVSQMRCGGLPRRAAPVVPLSTIAPASRLEKPSTRVYSSPKPTQPESNTIGDCSSKPQKRVLSAPDRGVGAAVAVAVAMRPLLLGNLRGACVPCDPARAANSAQYRQHHSLVRQYGLPAASDRAVGLRAGSPLGAARGSGLCGSGARADAREPAAVSAGARR